MTLVAAIADGTNVWMSIDSSITVGDDVTIRMKGKDISRYKVSTSRGKTAKPVYEGDMLIGMAGANKVSSMLQDWIPPYRHPSNEPLDVYINNVCRSIERWLKDDERGWPVIQFTDHEDGDSVIMDGGMIIGYLGHIWYVAGDLCPVEPAMPWFALGSGSEFAGGILALRQYQESLFEHPPGLLETITELCAEYISTVKGPVSIEHIGESS